MNSTVIDRDLLGELTNAIKTARIQGNENNSKSLDKVFPIAVDLTSLSKNMELMGRIKQILASLPDTDNSFNDKFFKKSSYQISGEKLGMLSSKFGSLKTSFFSRTKGIPIMDSSLYRHILRDSSYPSISTVFMPAIEWARSHHNSYLIDEKNPDETVRRIIKFNSHTIRGSNSQKKYIVLNGDGKEFDFVDACLEVTNIKFRERMASSLKKIRDLKFKKFSQIVKTSYDIYELEEEIFKCNNAIKIIKEVLELIKSNAEVVNDEDYFSELVASLNDDIFSYYKTISNLSDKVYEMKNAKKSGSNGTHGGGNNGKKISELNGLKDNLLNASNHTTPNVNEKSTTEPIFTFEGLSDEEKAKYERYKEIRNKFDEIFVNKNSYKDEEAFRRDLIVQMYRFNIGSTYEEIIQNMADMRNSLKVTKAIEDIIYMVRSSYDNYDDMMVEESNKLTNFENRIVGMFSSVRMHGNVSDELISEMNYYVSKMHNVETELKLVPRKEEMNDEDYRNLVDFIKIKHLINTLFLDENGLVTKVRRGR